MHNFPELVDRCALFTLNSLKDVEDRTLHALQSSGATHLVKTLQMIRLEKTILAVGMFSIFDGILQERLACENGFTKAKEILKIKGDLTLLSQFTDLELAVNALKHGRGRSYNALIENEGGSLPSNVKQPDEKFFDEGDISEITSLIDVDDSFINSCVEIIKKVSESIKHVRPEIVL